MEQDIGKIIIDLDETGGDFINKIGKHLVTITTIEKKKGINHPYVEVCFVDSENKLGIEKLFISEKSKWRIAEFNKALGLESTGKKSVDEIIKNWPRKFFIAFYEMEKYTKTLDELDTMTGMPKQEEREICKMKKFESVEKHSEFYQEAIKKHNEQFTK